MKLQYYFTYPDNILSAVNDADIESLVDIINDAYSYQDATKGSKRTNVEHLTKRIQETQFFVTKCEDRISGCFYVEDKFPALHFGLLTVINDFRGKGLAQAMMSAIEDFAKSENFKSVELDYMSLAPWLKTYYEKHGYKETGDVETWGLIDLVRMSKSLS